MSAEFTCDVVGPILTPYAAGEWAPEGSLYLVLTLSTELRAYTETNGLGGGARYAAGSVKVKTSIDGAASDELPAERGRLRRVPDPGDRPSAAGRDT